LTQFSDNRIIAPPIEEEVYPYRRVWRSISIQVSVMIVLTTVVLFAGEILGIQFSQNVNTILSLILAIIPAILWMMFSVLPERYVVEPRPSLVIVFVISGLAAAAIGIPFVRDTFQIDRWLPLETALQRILGFTFTVGIVDTAIKFIVLRYFVFPQHLRIRTDTIAYCTASAIGYSLTVNLFAISDSQAVYSLSMIYILANYVMQLISSLFLAYGLSETYFDNALFIAMPINILIASLIVGFISPFVTGLMNGPLTTGGNAARPIFSMGFLIAVLLAFLSIIFFLYNVAEQREREAFAADES
jgi:hypothetical protein